MNTKQALVILAAVLWGAAEVAAAGAEEGNLPIVTGNFSVMWIQHSPVGAFPDPNFNGEGVPPPENWAGHRKAGLSAYEDYVAWGAVEREPGKWDWSRQIEVADAQRAGGLEYDPYLWIHNPPMWMRESSNPKSAIRNPKSETPRLVDSPPLVGSETEGRKCNFRPTTRVADQRSSASIGGSSLKSAIRNPKSEIVEAAPDHYTVMRCLEHGEETQTFSIWDPATVKWFERFYREMHKALGDKIGRTYVGLVGPYGEGNYPLPIFDWLNIGHCHEGYWCGDEYARRAFRAAMKRRYVTLKRLNDAWGTEFSKWSEVAFPPEIKDGRILKAEERTDPKARRRWVDFIEWYHQSLIDFSVEVTRAALKHFPIEKLKMKPGGSAGGVNPIAWGTYCPGYAKALGRARLLPSHETPAWQEPRPPGRIRLQPADCHGRPFGDRWYGTAYRFYGIPLTTEPAGGLSERDFRRRVFMDACNGATEMFSYEWDKHKLDGLKWIHLYDGVPSITDVAVYCPTTWYRMNGDLWPMIRAADSLRDITDFEVADEVLIRDDYLSKAKIRVLIWLRGPVVERPVLEKIIQWVESGGILVSAEVTTPTDVEGRTDLGMKLFPPVSQDKPLPVTHRLGRGFVLRLVMPDAAKDPKFANLVRTAVYHLEELSTVAIPAASGSRQDAGGTLRGAPEVDSQADGVWTAVFPNRLLLYNTGDKPINVARTWSGGILKIHLEAGELAEMIEG